MFHSGLIPGYDFFVDKKVVAIIGGGFSGTLVAYHLTCLALSDLEIKIFDEKGRFARGVAYGTGDKNHLLNVPAERMSAIPDEPLHFVNWLKEKNFWDPKKTFYPRMYFGDYLFEFFRKSQVKTFCEKVIKIRHTVSDKLIIETSLGNSLEVDVVVLATGNYFSSQFLGLSELSDGARYLRFSEDNNITSFRPSTKVAILGSGLSAIDAILSLRDRGVRTEVCVFSRRGRFPLSHDKKSRKGGNSLFLNESSPLDCLRYFQSCRKLVFARRFDWRQEVERFRPFSNSIWMNWNPRQKAQFHRHLRKFWEIHRHRMPPEIAESINKMVANGEVRIRAVRNLQIKIRNSKFRLMYLDGRKGLEVEEDFDLVIDCTGFENDFSKINDPLIQSILKHLLVSMDSTKMGLDFEGEGRVVNKRKSKIYCIGPLRRGKLFESTAVPELRVQAKNLALELASILKYESSNERAVPSFFGMSMEGGNG